MDRGSGLGAQLAVLEWGVDNKRSHTMSWVGNERQVLRNERPVLRPDG